STGVAVGMLLPFLRVDSNCVPKTLLRLGHPRVSLTDSGQQRGFGYWFPIRHDRCLANKADGSRADGARAPLTMRPAQRGVSPHWSFASCDAMNVDQTAFGFQTLRIGSPRPPS